MKITLLTGFALFAVLALWTHVERPVDRNSITVAAKTPEPPAHPEPEGPDEERVAA